MKVVEKGTRRRRRGRTKKRRRISSSSSSNSSGSDSSGSSESDSSIEEVRKVVERKEEDALIIQVNANEMKTLCEKGDRHHMKENKYKVKSTKDTTKNNKEDTPPAETKVGSTIKGEKSKGAEKTRKPRNRITFNE